MVIAMCDRMARNDKTTYVFAHVVDALAKQKKLDSEFTIRDVTDVVSGPMQLLALKRKKWLVQIQRHFKADKGSNTPTTYMVDPEAKKKVQKYIADTEWFEGEWN